MKKLFPAFTLVEMLVVLGILSLILGAISGIFISVVSVQRRNLSLQEAIDQSSYVLEYMSRSLRMAQKDDLEGENCLSGNKVNYELIDNGRGIRFKNSEGKCQEFYLEGKKIMEKKDNKIFPLTAIEIDSLKFEVIGETQDDELQPKVTISFVLSTKGNQFNFQTTVSQRNLDVKF